MSLRVSLSAFTVTLPALCRQSSNDPCSSASADKDPLWISISGAKTAMYCSSSGTRSDAVQV